MIGLSLALPVANCLRKGIPNGYQLQRRVPVTEGTPVRWVGGLWRGEIPLSRAFWLFGVLIPLLLAVASKGIAFAAMMLMLLAGFSDGPSAPGSLLYGPVLVVCAMPVIILAYQVVACVGVWRSARQFSGKQLYAIVARVAVCLYLGMMVTGAVVEAYVLIRAWVRPEDRRADSTSATSVLPGNTANVALVHSTDFVASEKITAATSLRDGGFLAFTTDFSRQDTGPTSFAYRIASDGSITWRKELGLPKDTRGGADAAGASEDGSFWLTGNFMSAALDPISGRVQVSGLQDFAERVEPDGTILPAAVLGSKGDVRLSRCVAKARGAYVKVSSVDLPPLGWLRVEVPRVSMIDETGKILWERMLDSDHGRRIVRDSSRLANSNDQAEGCGGVIVTKDDRIIVGARINVFPDAKTVEEALEEIRRDPRHLQSATLLVALDWQGNELASVRHDETTGALLIDSPQGERLFETAQKHEGGSENVIIKGQHLSLYTFDSNLKETRAAIRFDDTNFDIANAAFPTAEGGLIIKGCSGDYKYKDRDEYVRYLAPSGSISPKRFFPELGLYCGGVFSFSPDPKGHEGLLLVQTPQQGNRVLHLSYN